LPDRKYANVTVQQFINKVMRDGKRSTAEGIVYDAVERAEQATRKSAVEVFETAMKNATATPRGQAPPGRRRDVPGPRGDPPGPPRLAGDALAHPVRAQAARQVHGREARR